MKLNLILLATILGVVAAQSPEKYDDLDTEDIAFEGETHDYGKRAARPMYSPNICRETNFRNCQRPNWIVQDCYDFGSLNMNDRVRSYQLPKGITCAAYVDSRCRGNPGIWKASASSLSGHWQGASSIRCRVG